MSPKDRILARRAKFVAAAIVGVAGCGSEAQVCLTPLYDASTSDTRDGADTRDAADTNPMPCLAPQPEDSAVTDSGSDTKSADSSISDTSVSDTGGDTFPVPCLSMPPPDSGDL